MLTDYEKQQLDYCVKNDVDSLLLLKIKTCTLEGKTEEVEYIRQKCAEMQRIIPEQPFTLDLFEAIEHHQIERVEQLLQSPDTNMYETKNNITPLHLLIHHFCIDSADHRLANESILHIFLKHHPDLSVKNGVGETPSSLLIKQLCYSWHWKRPELVKYYQSIVEILITHGADVFYKAPDDLYIPTTPLDKIPDEITQWMKEKKQAHEEKCKACFNEGKEYFKHMSADIAAIKSNDIKSHAKVRTNNHAFYTKQLIRGYAAASIDAKNNMRESQYTLHGLQRSISIQRIEKLFFVKEKLKELEMSRTYAKPK